MSWLSMEEISKIGFASFGTNIQIDRDARFIGANHIHLESDIRIDSNVIITAGPGEVKISSGVHVAHGSKLLGTAGIDIGKGAGVSSNCSIFSASDNYSSGHLANPMSDPKTRNVTTKHVTLGEYSIIGSTSVVLPGVVIGFGASIGALTLVHRNVPAGMVVSGNPMRKVGNRDLSVLKNFLEDSPRQ